jgi:hypothetical protein
MRLQLVGPGRAAAERAGDQGHALGDAGGVPQAAVLFGHRDQVAVRAGARRAPRVGEQHEREQPGHLAVIGQQAVHDAGGGMGRVFLGRSPGGRQVAVKMIRAELAEQADFRIRFAQEVAAARTVSGLFTAPVVDADLDAPVPWLATAYVRLGP